MTLSDVVWCGACVWEITAKAQALLKKRFLIELVMLNSGLVVGIPSTLSAPKTARELLKYQVRCM